MGVAVGLTGVMTLAACSKPGPEPTDPGRAAEPAAVVTQFIAAVNHRDADVLHLVATQDEAQRMEEVWFGSRIDSQGVATVAPEADGSGRMAVTVVMSVHGGDGSLPDNPFSWTYFLVKDEDSGRWLVSDDGQG